MTPTEMTTHFEKVCTALNHKRHYRGGAKLIKDDLEVVLMNERHSRSEWKRIEAHARKTMPNLFELFQNMFRSRGRPSKEEKSELEFTDPAEDPAIEGEPGEEVVEVSEEKEVVPEPEPVIEATPERAPTPIEERPAAGRVEINPIPRIDPASDDSKLGAFLAVYEAVKKESELLGVRVTTVTLKRILNELRIPGYEWHYVLYHGKKVEPGLYKSLQIMMGQALPEKDDRGPEPERPVSKPIPLATAEPQRSAPVPTDYPKTPLFDKPSFLADVPLSAGTSSGAISPRGRPPTAAEALAESIRMIGTLEEKDVRRVLKSLEAFFSE